MKSIRRYIAIFLILVTVASCSVACDRSVEPSVQTTIPQDTTTVPEDTTTVPEDTTTVPEDTTTVPEDTTTEPEDTTTIPEDTTTEPTSPDIEAPHEHTPEVLPAVSASCSSTGLTEGSKCSTCFEILVAQTVIPKTDHSPVKGAVIAPSWETVGSRGATVCSGCSGILSPQITLPAIKTMNGSYGYEDLLTLEKGEALASLYRSFEDVAVSFHNDNSKNTETVGEYNNIVAAINYSELGLTSEEAKSVWSCFRGDHPLFYWISPTILTNSQTIYLLCDMAFINGADRHAANLEIYEAIFELFSDESSPYMLAFSYHESIISGMEYAYESDGVTPQDDDIYHGIAGFVLESSGVCEAYAKMFQLLLNYSGVENVLVNGTANGGGHAWNLAKMDDGKWYWFDLTWDDTPDWKWGVSYNYFCVNDTENTIWREGFTVNAPQGFTESHAVEGVGTHGVGYMWRLPSRSSSSFSHYDTAGALKQSFTQDGVTYLVVGYRKVEISSINKTGNVSFPGSVEYAGVRYSVVAVGKRSEASNKQISYQTKVTVGEVTSVAFCDGLERIWDCAFYYDQTLTSVTIPKSVNYIGFCSFYACFSLREIHYEGSYAEWQAIEKHKDWNAYSPSFTLYCSDGTYEVSYTPAA